MLTRVPRIAPSEITPAGVYFNRRTFLAGAVASAASATLPAGDAAPPSESALTYRRNPQYSVSEPPNRLEEIAGYNNFYEFGTDKESPSRYAHTLRTRPWSVTVQGEAEVRGRFDLEDLLKGRALEERVYRFRCVEAWSLVVPWIGFPLSELLARFKPTSSAKYVEFTTLYDPARMPGQHSGVLSRHPRRIVQRRELDVLGARGGFEARQQLAQGKADPRHHQRPRLDAAESIDALLERPALEQVLEVEPAAHFRLALHRHAPGSGPERVCVAAGGFLVGAELIEIVVAGDFLEPVGRLADGILRIAPVTERAFRGWRGFPGGEGCARSARHRAGEECAPVEVDPSRGDLGWGDPRHTSEHT